jgi:hypothetical protein
MVLACRMMNLCYLHHTKFEKIGLCRKKVRSLWNCLGCCCCRFNGSCGSLWILFDVFRWALFLSRGVMGMCVILGMCFGNQSFLRCLLINFRDWNRESRSHERVRRHQHFCQKITQSRHPKDITSRYVDKGATPIAILISTTILKWKCGRRIDSNEYSRQF